MRPEVTTASVTPVRVRSTGDRRRARIIAVGGGKGGVGKSLVAANLAVALAQAGQRVVLVDADLGSANQHTLFGISRPLEGLAAVLDGRAASLGATLCATEVPRLSLVAGTFATLGAANITHAEKRKLLRKIAELDADVLVVDVGAGVSFNVLDFFDLGHQRVVVVTPQLTSIQNAYSFLKSSVIRVLSQRAGREEPVELLESCMGGSGNETGRVGDMIARIRAQSPAFARTVEERLAEMRVYLVGNQVFEPGEANIFASVARMMQDYLCVNVTVLGHLRASRAVHDSVARRRPHLVLSSDASAVTMRSMAAALLASEAPGDLLGEEPSSSAPLPPVDESEALLHAMPHLRRFPRYGVRWTGRIVRPGEVVPVQVLDVSKAGSSLQTRAPLAVGESWTLQIDDLPDVPGITAIVRYVLTLEQRVGIEFEGLDAALAARLVAAAWPGGPSEAMEQRLSL
jgi:flagellar biosynthesis protein FlhG